MAKIRKASEEYKSPIHPLIKLLFILLILLLMPKLVTSKRRTGVNKRKIKRIQKSLNIVKANCIESCDPSKMAENQMCISKCMNEGCHDEIYGEEHGGELELGEVDELRNKAFELCVKDAIRREQVAARNNVAAVDAQDGSIESIGDEEDDDDQEEVYTEGNEENDEENEYVQDEIIAEE